MTCTNPFEVKHGDFWIKVPCMYCLACRITKISHWTLRILCEMQKYKGLGLFITLTYKPEYLPEHASLIKEDVQKWVKRIRKEFSKEKNKSIKYFCCGEYGELGQRPHYHLIMLGLSWNDRLILDDKWQLGKTYYGTVEHASIRYCVSYIMDKGRPEDYAPRLQPFQLSSKNFGNEILLQKKEIEKYLKDGYITLEGKKIAIPRFLKEILEIKNSGFEISMKDKLRFKESVFYRRDDYKKDLIKKYYIDYKIEEEKKLLQLSKNLQAKERINSSRQKKL